MLASFHKQKKKQQNNNVEVTKARLFFHDVLSILAAVFANFARKKKTLIQRHNEWTMSWAPFLVTMTNIIDWNPI